MQTPDSNDLTPAEAAERRPWTAPALTEIDLSEKTETGTSPYSSEGSTFPNDRYTS